MMEMSKRITFTFTAEAIELMDAMKQRTKSLTCAEVIRDALRFLEWLKKTEAEGNEIGVIRDGEIVKTVKFLF